MRRLINDPQPRKQPLKILEQKIPVFEKSEHAQIHANAGDEPPTFCMLIFGFAHLSTKPEIHGGRPEQEPGEGRVPGSIKNVAGYDEKVFTRLPGTYAPVNRDDDCEENDESERVEKHGEPMTESRWLGRQSFYLSHTQADV
jgi:hypothetical protein